MRAQAGAATHAGSTIPRALAVARFAALQYVFILVFLLLAALLPGVLMKWRPLAVVSGSMQPALRAGAVVLVEPAQPGRFYATPSIIAFHDAARPGRLVTHRVVNTSPSGDAVTYTTKGDANRVTDSAPVPHDAVFGGVRMVVPFVGLPAKWLRDGDVATFATWALASMMAVAVLFCRKLA